MTSAKPSRAASSRCVGRRVPGGIAAVGQLQLRQPLFGLALAAGLLGEAVSPAMLAVTMGVLLCVAGARRFSR
ncbi:hypothetical protein [Roseateles sp. DAIF2]|uniref:hypothetical protein n=1 Tax=Roseateles sp. DAIF2 TaxID=2714952 RepID=UPI0035302445